MIENLTVENYRSFENYSMNNLKRVNLLTGLNNSGKTSLLEAVEILASRGDETHLLRISSRRGDAPSEFLLDGPRQGTATHFFRDRDLANLIRIKSNSVSVTIRLPAENETGIENDYCLLVESKTLNGWRTVRIPMKESNQFGSMLPRPEKSPFWRVEFVGNDQHDDFSLSEYWDEVLVNQSEKDVVSSLRLLDNQIVSVAYVSGGKRRSGMYVGLKNHKQRTPLGSHGEGVNRLLSIAVLLAVTKGGILLVDEIDTGLHYSVLADMWKLVIGTAIKNDIQVFATTHSFDCLRGLNEACERNPEYASEISLQTIDRSLNCSISGDANDLKSAMNLGVEVR